MDLHAFLAERRITALCCVPTLLATIEEDLPDLRFLLVSGEACPQDLIARWHRPGRRFLNVYGPTEATVTATWTELHPDQPGHHRRAAAHLHHGHPRPGRTRPRAAARRDRRDRHRRHRAGHRLPQPRRPDRQGVHPGLPRHRRQPVRAASTAPATWAGSTPTARSSTMGRIDLQVKIRGYRIELTEIESVLLQVPGIAASRGRHLRADRRASGAGRLLQPAQRGRHAWTRTRSPRTCASSCPPTWCRPTSSSWTRSR